MKLTKTVDYGLRLILFLGQQTQLVSMPKVSETLNIPYNNLIKIVSKLSKAGLITTSQGKFGGIQLALPASDLNLLRVVEAIDGPIALLHCLDQNSNKVAPCTFICSCSLKGVFSTLQTQMKDYLGNVYVSDVGQFPKLEKEVSYVRN